VAQMIVLIAPVAMVHAEGWAMSSTRVGSASDAAARRCYQVPLSRAHASMVSSSLPILRSDNAHMLRSEPANCALP